MGIELWPWQSAQVCPSGYKTPEVPIARLPLGKCTGLQVPEVSSDRNRGHFIFGAGQTQCSDDEVVWWLKPCWRGEEGNDPIVDSIFPHGVKH